MHAQRPAAPVLLAVVFHVGLVAAYVAAYRGDVSSLVCVDERAIGRYPFEFITTGFSASGFDGQYYYAIARNPWVPHTAHVDLPAYRHARILYPAICWAFSGGDPQLLLWVMPAVNLAAIAALTWLGCLVAVHFGRSAWWGFLLPTALNIGMPALRNLTDPVATLAAFAVIAAWLLEWRTAWLCVFAIAAVFSREQNVIIVGIVLMSACLQQSWSRVFAAAFAIAVLACWVIVLRWQYGTWPTAPDNLSVPFAGMWYRWTHMAGLSGPRSVPFHAAGMVLLSLQVAISVAMISLRADRVALLVALAGAAMAVFGGTGIFLNGWSYPRVFSWMPLGIWLWSMQSGRSWPATIMAGAIMWPIVAVIQVWLV